MVVDSPVGKLTLLARGSGLCAILWPDDKPGRVRIGAPVPHAGSAILIETARQLAEYFAGSRTRFALELDLPARRFKKRYGKPC